LLITPHEQIKDAYVIIEEGKIKDFGRGKGENIPKDAMEIDARDKIVAPGFIDIHIHGGGGYASITGGFGNFKSSPEDVSKFCAKHGTTSFLATTEMVPKDTLLKAASEIKEYVKKETPGAEILGLHMEGPYINPKKLGAAREDFLRNPSIEEYEEIMERSSNAVKLITLAPELPGALEFIRYAVSKGTVVSLGHSYATYEEFLAGIKAGATHTCHAFNAMRELHHRHPNVVGGMLSHDGVTAELIGDSFHVHPAVIKILIRCKGPDKVALITDSVPLAGLPEGEYELEKRKVIVRGGKCFLPRPPVSSALAGTDQEERIALAGSIVTMDVNVKNMVHLVGLSLLDAIKMASTTPARIISVDDRKGEISPGKDADIVIMDEGFNVKMTLVKGKVVYKSES